MKTLMPLLFACVVCATPLPAGEVERVVFLAPGFPSNTEEAQPTMDMFATALAARLGRPQGSLVAAYHPDLERGLAALRSAQTALAVVTLPVFLEYRESLELQPLLAAVAASGEDERWALVAAQGSIAAPSDLEGWSVVGIPGYSPRFVERVALGDWGALPSGSEIRFEPRVLSALRGAARGERLAVLLDRAQADSIASLPYAADLEIVARSPSLDGSLLCSVGSRMAQGRLDALKRALVEWHTIDDGERLLSTFRLSRFAPFDAARLNRLAERFSTAAAGP